MDDIELMHYAVAKSLREVKELRSFVEDVADGDCSYGDGCPESTMNRRGRCIWCKARLCLEKLTGKHIEAPNAPTSNRNSR